MPVLQASLSPEALIPTWTGRVFRVVFKSVTTYAQSVSGAVQILRRTRSASPRRTGVAISRLRCLKADVAHRLRWIRSVPSSRQQRRSQRFRRTSGSQNANVRFLPVDLNRHAAGVVISARVQVESRVGRVYATLRCEIACGRRINPLESDGQQLATGDDLGNAGGFRKQSGLAGAHASSSEGVATRKTNDAQVDRRCELILKKLQDAALIRAGRIVLFGGSTGIRLRIESMLRRRLGARDVGSPRTVAGVLMHAADPPGRSVLRDADCERPSAIFPPVAGTLVRPARLCAGGRCPISRHDRN